MALATTTDTTASLRRAAILLTTLEVSVARRMLESLPPVRRAAVRRAMTGLADVDPLERKRALQDFLADAGRASQPGRQTPADSFQLQTDDRRSDAISAPPEQIAGPVSETAPLAFLGDVGDDVLLSAVAGEHPQTIAIVLASLAPHQAARLLPRLDDALRQQAMIRLGRLQHLPPDALDSIGGHLRRLLADTRPEKIGGGTGGRSLMAILAEMPHELRGPLAKSLDLAPELVEALGSDAPPTSAGGAAAHDSAKADFEGGLRIAPATRHITESSSHLDRTDRLRSSLDPRTGPADDAGVSRFRPAAADGDDLELVDSQAVDRHLMMLPPRGLRDALAAVEARDALLALCGLQAQVADAVLALLPRRQARQVRKQLQTMGPLQLREIDRAKLRVAAAAGLSAGADLPSRPARVPVAA